MIDHKQPEKTVTELRKFAAVMVIVPGLLSAVAWYRGRAGTEYVLLAVTLFFLCFGIVAPTALRPIERAWMAFGELMGRIVTPIVLTLTFYCAITPVALLLRVLGKDPLDQKIDKQAASYWVPSDASGSGSRHYLPY